MEKRIGDRVEMPPATQTQGEREECAYCGATECSEDIPSQWADDEWIDLAKDHLPGCEWVETRAHRR